MRVRRSILGEIKERKEGGLYYTKPFRELMNCILEVQDFFDGTLKSGRSKEPEYFYRHMLSFFKSARYVANKAEGITADSVASLERLKVEVEKEIFDLKRFRQKVGGVDVYLYADRIERREQLLKEIDKISAKVAQIGEDTVAFSEFYEYIKGEKTFTAIGSGASFVDIVRYFYRETVKKYKQKYNMADKGLVPSDAYAICLICQYLGRRLSPKHTFVFVDEAQDISECEYTLLRAINESAVFNLFGDVEQNVTAYRGVKDWKIPFPDFEIFYLNQNYRNTNQIVDFVATNLQVDMQSIGYEGPPVERITQRGINAFFKDKKGLKTIICAPSKKEEYLRKSYHNLSEKGVVSKSKINIMTVYESKGLEFSSVAVIPDGMSKNERYIAYTRALQYLAVVEKGEKE